MAEWTHSHPIRKRLVSDQGLSHMLEIISERPDTSAIPDYQTFWKYSSIKIKRLCTQLQIPGSYFPKSGNNTYAIHQNIYPGLSQHLTFPSSCPIFADMDFLAGQTLLFDKPKTWTSFDVVKKKATSPNP